MLSCLTKKTLYFTVVVYFQERILKYLLVFLKSKNLRGLFSYILSYVQVCLVFIRRSADQDLFFWEFY